ncbi:efflux RND transporter permease subunit [Tahibacter soli]|jgi:multidrug efflux pump|uniref:Efflux RND transporter permease subunit n=1 Tax=Tahibacter soli TaxID=2983605 RepID=A0A9X4BGS6_9GAMM|nr:efflux RND transporter permease subunit [Tahibacter soli]MDC8013215.1 efflux RND transporter permease subunit [Tahibacter soli]
MILSDVSIRRPVFATVVNLVILLVGFICYERLAVRLIPKVDVPIVNVSTSYPGASAQVIESQITTPIEEQLSGIEGIDYIQSVSREESSQITVRFRIDRDADSAAADVRDRVALSRDVLPQEAREPVVQKQEADAQPIIYLAFSSDRHSLLEIADLAKRLVKDRVQNIAGVAQAQIYGNRYAMRIWLDPARLASYQMTPADVEDALRRQNLEVPAGRIESTQREFTVLSETDLKTPEEFGAIVLRTGADGYAVRVRDVARVELGGDQARFIARYNGRTAVPLGVVKQATANPLQIAESLKTLLPEITRTLPQGMKVEIAYDSTIFIDRSISEVYKTIGEAILLVVIVIFLFLRSGRAALIPIVTIPVSLVGAFALMYLFGFSINTLTLLALVLAIGLVVDDAIVMLENIYRHVEEGMPPMQAALKGSREIGFAIIAMTLTLAAVYVPLAFSTGRTGRLFIEFALTLAGAVIVSGFTALTLSPMMCSRLLKHSEKHGKAYELGEKVLNGIQRGYEGGLRWGMRQRAIVLGFAGLVMVGLVALFWFRALPNELAPQEDQGMIIGFGMAPEGATPEYTDSYAKQMESMFSQLPGVDRYFQIVGFPTVTQTIGFVGLKDWSERDTPVSALQGMLFPQFMGIPGVLAFPVLPPALGQDDFGQPVSFVVQTTGTWEDLDRITNGLLAKIRENPQLTNPDTDLKLNKPQLKIDMDRDKIAAVGADVNDVGRTLESLLGGRQVTRFKRGSEQYDVLVQVANEGRQVPEQLSAIYVRGGDGQMVQMANLVTAKEAVAAKELNHFNRLRSATISAGIAPGYSMGEALEYLAGAVKEVASDAQYDFSGQSREFRESSSSTWMLFGLALVFIFLVLAAQFESWIDPLIILLSVPLAMFGAIGALWLLSLGAGAGLWHATGSMNIYTQIGLITLVGLIAKHGIMIVEFANQLQAQGRTKVQAAFEAARLRLRPILMTTGAMVLGALPLALASGAGSESRHQIGWVIVGGMSFGTLLTLFVVPVVYTLLARKHQAIESEHGAGIGGPAHA